MRRIAIACALILIFTLANGSAYAYNTELVVAYPIPYNPYRGVMTIDDLSGVTFNKVKIRIFDINGDKVYSGTFPGYQAIWNGRNERGRVVKPGMYILIVEAEDVFTGLYGKKVIRILVAY